jgi:hypothetical protein
MAVEETCTGKKYHTTTTENSIQSENAELTTIRETIVISMVQAQILFLLPCMKE